MYTNVRSLLIALLVFGHIGRCLADEIDWPPLNRLQCYSSFEEIFGDEVNAWVFDQLPDNYNYTGAYYSGTAKNGPSKYFYNENNKQCLILQVLFGANMSFKFSPNGQLIEVIANESPRGEKDTGPFNEIVFKLGKDGYFIESECKLNYFMNVMSLSYPCEKGPFYEPYIHPSLPSFDCEKAHSGIENLICQNDNISLLDTILDLNYKHIVSVLADKRAPVVAEQKAWIKQRNTCKTKECLTEAYKTRLRDLCAKYSSLFGKSDSGVLYKCVTFDQ